MFVAEGGAKTHGDMLNLGAMARMMRCLSVGGGHLKFTFVMGAKKQLAVRSLSSVMPGFAIHTPVVIAALQRSCRFVCGVLPFYPQHSEL
jgi:hypothetical protein